MSGAPTEEEMLRGFRSTTKAVEGDKKIAPEPAAPSLDAPDDRKRMRSIVDRIVRLEEEKRGLSGDIKEIYEEAKSAGYSKKAVRIVVKREMEDAEQRASREATEAEAETILAALGDFASSALGEAAVGRGRH